jgi:hypothetical protein
MAEAFIENSVNKTEVNHKDGNKLNNDLSNLEWVTHSENILHAYSISRSKKTLKDLNYTFSNTKLKHMSKNHSCQKQFLNQKIQLLKIAGVKETAVEG